MSNVLISHFHKDSKLAKELNILLKRVSLHQIQPWHSSDEQGSGGIGAGDNWINKIRQKLSESKAIIALITPQSLKKPWIYFESGFGAANSELEVIPLCVGIDSINSVPFPLAMYQAFQLDDRNSIETFLSKLFSKLDLTFDKEMAKVVIDDFFENILQFSNYEDKVTSRETIDLKDVVDDIKQHFDRRLLKFSESLSEKTVPFNYSIPIIFTFNCELIEKTIQIDTDDTVQDKMDQIYSFIQGHVKPFTYLKSWILIEYQTNTRLILKEVQDRIPAKIIFSPGSKWIIKLLDKPYEIQDSDSFYEDR